MIIRVLAFLLSLVIFFRASFFSLELPILNILYYTTLVIAFFYLLPSVLIKKIHLDSFSLMFLSIACLSIVVNDVNPFFRAWERLGLFFLLMSVLGPLNQSYKASFFRKNVLFHVEYMSIVFTILSLFIGLLGISFVLNKGFSGISVHSMTLAPISAIAALVSLSRFFQKQKYHKFYLLTFIISLITVFLTASRGALGALGIACSFVFIFYFKKNKGRGLKSILLLVGFISFIFILNPLGLMDNLYNKMEARGDNITSGRDIMLIDRFLDFQDSPFLGVGFASAVNTDFTKIDYELGTIEPGSSIVFILSSMGILGVISYLLIWINKFKNTLKNRDLDVTSAVAIFFFFHSMIEGYAISAGSPICAFMWLFLGIYFKTDLNKR